MLPSEVGSMYLFHEYQHIIHNYTMDNDKAHMHS